MTRMVWSSNWGPKARAAARIFSAMTGSGSAAAALDDGLEAVDAVLLIRIWRIWAGFAGDFEDAVGGDDEQIAGSGIEGCAVKGRDGQEAEGKLLLLGIGKRAATGVPVQQRRAGGEGVVDGAISTETQAGEGGVHVRFLHFREHGVEAVEQYGQRTRGLALAGIEKRGAGGGFEHAHEDAGLQTVAGDVGEVGNGIAAGEADGIDEIAADLFAGAGDAVDIEGRGAEHDGRNEGLLDAVGEGQFVGHAEGLEALAANESDEEDVGKNDGAESRGGSKVDAVLRGNGLEVEGVNERVGDDGFDLAQEELQRDEEDEVDAGRARDDDDPEDCVEAADDGEADSDRVGQLAAVGEVNVIADDGEDQEDRGHEHGEAAQWNGAEVAPAGGCVQKPQLDLGGHGGWTSSGARLEDTGFEPL